MRRQRKDPPQRSARRQAEEEEGEEGEEGEEQDKGEEDLMVTIDDVACRSPLIAFRSPLALILSRF